MKKYLFMIAAACVLLSVVGLLLWRVQRLDNELNRVSYAKTEAVEALHAEMERRAETDPLLAEGLASDAKSVKECYDFITELVGLLFSVVKTLGCIIERLFVFIKLFIELV